MEKYFAARIQQCRAFKCFFDNTFRRQLYFAAVAGGVDREVGDGEAGKIGAEVAHDVESGLKRGAEMFHATHEIALEQIIRADAVVVEFAAEFLNQWRGVVDATKQNSLVYNRDSGVGEFVRGGNRLRRDFTRMIEVCANDNRRVASQGRDEV